MSTVDLDKLMRSHAEAPEPNKAYEAYTDFHDDPDVKFYREAYVALPSLVDELKELRNEKQSLNSEAKRIFTREFNEELKERTIEADQLSITKYALIQLVRDLRNAAKDYAAWNMHGLASEEDQRLQKKAYERLKDMIGKSDV